MSTNPLCTPWTLEFDRDGTEDFGVICEADGETLVTSRPFWLPEEGEPTPPTLAALRVMVAAPKLLEALAAVLADAKRRRYSLADNITEFAREAIAEATDGSIGRAV